MCFDSTFTLASRVELYVIQHVQYEKNLKGNYCSSLLSRGTYTVRIDSNITIVTTDHIAVDSKGSSHCNG